MERDARLLTAYQSLSQDTDSWLQRLETQNLDELAQSLGLVRKTTGSFQRREVRAEQLTVPAIPGLEAADTFTDQAFVDMVFDRAETLAQGDGVLATVRSGRSLAIPVASKLSLYLVTIEDFLPMNQREYDQTLSMYPRIAMWIHQLLTGEVNTEPLALGPLKKRTGFVEEGRSAEDEESQP
ncbi:MAG: hypothetical protein HC898_00540 [Phycisphaerales bacterium]|nr:hypothetical protein [Phycisphaerales bacterium]